MALTYITKAAEIAARQTQNTANNINTLMQAFATEQARRNKIADDIVQKGQRYTDDFYTLYGEQTKSGNEAWNSGASQLVGELAAGQEELYTKAHGKNGTPELKHEWRLRQARDKQIIAQIGEWATMSNNNSTAMQENQSAHEQDIDLGRMTRSNDTDKYSFSQNMQNDQYSDFNFSINEKGNVVLNAQNIDIDGNIVSNDTRNLSADVADNKAGNEWYSQIKKDDLLENKLAKNWTDPKTGYNTYFKKRTESNKVYDADTGIWKTITKEVYDRDEVKRDLLNKYSNRLDSEIKGPGFEKTWDQLWRNGYLANNDGETSVAGEMSWQQFKKIKSMTSDDFKNTYGDLTGDGIVNDDDKRELEKQVMSTAREGLANYYSGNMVPAEDQITNVSVQGKGPESSEMSDQDIINAKAESKYYNNVRNNSSKIIKDSPIVIDNKEKLDDGTANPNYGKPTQKSYEKRVSQVVDEMNRNQTQKDLGKGWIYATGAEAYKIIYDNGQTLPNPPMEDRNIYRLISVKSAKNKETGTKTALKMYDPVLMIREEYIITEDPNVLTDKVASGINIDDKSQNYLKSKEYVDTQVNQEYSQ